MIKFEALAMKAKIDNLHAIFLLKKNIQMDIIIMTETTCRGQDISMNIGKPRYFNCNVYEYIAKDYRKPKKE